MDKFQAAFEILYLLSCVDGEVDKSELDVIIQFLKQNTDAIYFTPSEVIDSIDTLNAEGMLEELSTAIFSFKNNSSAVERTVLMKFAIELVIADGYISEGEKELLHIIANTLNLNLNVLLNKYT